MDSERQFALRVLEAQEIAAARTMDPYANPEKKDFDMVDTIHKTGLYTAKTDKQLTS